MRVGILTGGGDCPGLNAVIRAVVRKIHNAGGSCLGIMEGWRGLIDDLHRPLTAEESAGYVRHRLQAAGTTREIFTADALEALHFLGHGTPRQINRLGDLALLVGFADRLPWVTAQQIESVSEELVAIAAE